MKQFDLQKLKKMSKHLKRKNTTTVFNSSKKTGCSSCVKKFHSTIH